MSAKNELLKRFLKNPFMPVVIALLLGIATTAGAITASKRIRTADYGFQNPGQIEHLGGPALREILW